MGHLHNVYDNDLRFIINPATRAIVNESGKVKFIQRDHNSERFTFEIPRFVEEHDMSLCDKVEVHYINAGNKNEQSKDVYLVDDLKIDEWDENKIVFSWLVSKNATKYAGSLNFLIRFVCMDGEKIVYEWNTDVFKDIIVAGGINNSLVVIAEHSDVLEAWRQEVLFGTDGALTKIEAEKKKMLDEIEIAAEIVQTTGNSKTAVMSQKAVTDIVEDAACLGEIGILSKGEMRKIPTIGYTPFMTYRVGEDENIYAVDEGYKGTDYMPCPKYLLFDFNDETARLMIYFYDFIDGEYVPRWDILKYKTSTNILNFLNIKTTYNSVIEIPDGVYMRVATPINGDVNLYGWSGKHIGCEMSGTAYTPRRDENGGYNELSMETKRTGITLPGNATLFWIKEGWIRGVFGVDMEGNKADIPRPYDYVQFVRLPKGFKYFRVSISSRGSVSAEDLFASMTDSTYPNDWNDNASCLCDFTASRPYGRARQVLDHAKHITNIEWECKKRVGIANTSYNSAFEKNTKYKGIPYMSSWMKPCYFGWHITKHTFLNAANDEDSIFYAERGRKGGPGYGGVCSSFASLCAGFPHPIVTNGFLRDPNMRHIVTSKPQIGAIAYNNNGHCLIPDTAGDGADFSEYTIYECTSPLTLRRSNFDFYNSSSEVRDWKYINEYIYAVHHKDETGNPRAYNITDGTITNGSARPYRGDRSVYTSDDDVLINIKDTSATKCYVQRCTYDVATDTFTPTADEPFVHEFFAGTTQIFIDKSNLSNSCFYGVYTDTDNTMEYFEYYVAPTATYGMTNENYSFEVERVSQHNILTDYVVEDTTHQNVRYEWDGGNVCHVVGTATKDTHSYCVIAGQRNGMPDGFVAGKRYRVQVDKTEDSNGNKVILRIYYYDPNKSEEMLDLVTVTSSTEFTIPETATGLHIRIGIPTANSGLYVDETVILTVNEVNEPWYSVWWEEDTADRFTEIIPYDESGDYSGYRKVYNTGGADGVMFFKGTLGAYKTNLAYVAE